MTLKDVALLANCSVATVSKALKNSSEISDEAKKRILSVAKKSGYFEKAIKHKAVLGGYKTIIFNDISTNGFSQYKEFVSLAEKYELLPMYISVPNKKAKELLNQLGAFGLVLWGKANIETDSHIISLENDFKGLEEFLKNISQYKPSRPSRSGSTSQKKNLNKQTAEKQSPKVKEEIWLL